MKGIRPGDIVSIRVRWCGFDDTRYEVRVVSIDRRLRVTCPERLWCWGSSPVRIWRVPIGDVIR